MAAVLRVHLDVYWRMLVGWQLPSNMRTILVLDAQNGARDPLARR